MPDRCIGNTRSSSVIFVKCHVAKNRFDLISRGSTFLSIQIFIFRFPDIVFWAHTMYSSEIIFYETITHSSSKQRNEISAAAGCSCRQVEFPVEVYSDAERIQSFLWTNIFQLHTPTYRDSKRFCAIHAHSFIPLMVSHCIDSLMLRSPCVWVEHE